MNILKFVMIILLIGVILNSRRISELFESGPKMIDPTSARENIVKKNVFFNCVKYLTVRNYCLDPSIRACKIVIEKKEKEKAEQKEKENFAGYQGRNVVIYTS